MSMEVAPRIHVDPAVCHGKPVIQGTRTPVAIVLSHIAGGESFDDICKNYDITVDDIRACVAFANDEMQRTSFVTSSSLRPTGS